MADTTIATGNAATKKLWAQKTVREAAKMIYWRKFMPGGVLDLGKSQRGQEMSYKGDKGMGMSPIRVENQLKDTQGDQIYYDLIMKLTGSGVTGDSTLWDNEEALAHYSDSLTVDQVRNAVRPSGRMSTKRPAWNIYQEISVALSKWLSEKIDQDIFTELTNSSTKLLYGGDATSTATIEAGDYLTLAMIGKLKTLAKKQVPRFEPIRVDGEEYYLILISPDQEYDLQVTDTNWATAQQNARKRGMDNPVFSGAAGIWNNVIIHSHDDIPVSTTWGSGANIAGASAVFMGANALTFGWGMSPRWDEETRDYGNKKGKAITTIYGVKKCVFNSEDLAVIEVRTSRTNNALA